MKYRLWIPCLAVFLSSVLAVIILGSCSGGNPVTVSIVDGGSAMLVKGTDAMTVQRLIDQAGLSLRDNDVVTPDRNTKWRDAKADAITIDRCVRVTVSDGASEKTVDLAGGTVSDAVEAAGFAGKPYKCDADYSAELTDGMTIRLSVITDGLVQNGNTGMFLKGGEPQKDGIVGSEADGYYYADKDGNIDLGYCDGINVDGEDWAVIDGKATKVQSEADKTLFAACQAVAACTDSSMTKDEKLKAGYDYIQKNYLEGVLPNPPYREPDWPVVCANDLFVHGKGDCYSYGAAFAFMGKAMGFEEVYACNSGGHGWAEIDGLIYDPEWNLHGKNGPYFAISYDEDSDIDYREGIRGGSEWMRKKL